MLSVSIIIFNKAFTVLQFALFFIDISAFYISISLFSNSLSLVPHSSLNLGFILTLVIYFSFCISSLSFHLLLICVNLKQLKITTLKIFVLFILFLVEKNNS